MEKGIEISDGVYTLRKLTKSRDKDNCKTSSEDCNGCGCDGNCVCD